MERTPEAYTRSILAIALDPWMAGLTAVKTAYETDAKLRGKLDNPTLEIQEKLALLEGVLPEGSPAELRKFLGVLLTHNDFGLIDEIVEALARVLSAEAAGPQKAVITTAVALTDAEREQLEKRLVERFGSNLEFVYQVDPDILGGIIVQVGDKLIDDSVRGRLQALRQKLGVS
jgi:F-type H+-transporting ATPase subunit delta